MNDLIKQIDTVDSDGLDAELRVQFGERISGFSYDGELHIHFFEAYATSDETAAQAIVVAHDPVFISATRDGDAVTVTLTKPRNGVASNGAASSGDGATALTLTIDDTAAPDSTPLVNNVATVQIESADEITIGILEDYPHREVTI